MKFLTQPPRCLFFTGKGGVGKTSIACASAVRLAGAGKRVLLVSTDPASNIGQVFGVEIGNRITMVPAVDGLYALEIDPQVSAQAYREKIVGPVRGALPESVIRTIEEQLSGACTTEIAAFDEFTSLLVDREILERFHHVVFDTAPTGHTIRLLSLPGAWSSFLESGKGSASCLGPLAGLEKQRERYRAAVDALTNEQITRLVLVARAQVSTLKEAEKTYQELAAIGLRGQSLVINGILSERDASEDAVGRAIFEREQRAVAELPSGLRSLPCDRLELKPFNLVGVDALRGLFETGWSVNGDETSGVEVTLGSAHTLDDLVDEMATSSHGLLLVMGKGGVGKTTIAAAVAVSLARRGFPVHLTTTDPASHLGDSLCGGLDGLMVSSIDPEVETRRYQEEVLATRGATLDESGRALLEEELRSPCTQEIAVFQAFSRILRESHDRFVVVDTAPTGHTLLLLDATGAYHREVAKQASVAGDRSCMTPLEQLRDSSLTKVVVVTLPETVPVLEAAGLQRELRRAGIEPWAWVVNSSVAMAQPRGKLLRLRAAKELDEIRTVQTQHASRLAVVPLLPVEPIGAEALAALARGES